MSCKCPALAEPHAADGVKRSARGEGCDKWKALSFVLSVESIEPLPHSYQLPNAEKEAKSTRSSGRVPRLGLDVAKQLGARDDLSANAYAITRSGSLLERVKNSYKIVIENAAAGKYNAGTSRKHCEN